MKLLGLIGVKSSRLDAANSQQQQEFDNYINTSEDEGDFQEYAEAWQPEKQHPPKRAMEPEVEPESEPPSIVKTVTATLTSTERGMDERHLAKTTTTETVVVEDNKSPQVVTQNQFMQIVSPKKSKVNGVVFLEQETVVSSTIARADLATSPAHKRTVEASAIHQPTTTSTDSDPLDRQHQTNSSGEGVFNDIGSVPTAEEKLSERMTNGEEAIGHQSSTTPQQQAEQPEHEEAEEEEEEEETGTEEDPEQEDDTLKPTGEEVRRDQDEGDDDEEGEDDTQEDWILGDELAAWTLGDTRDSDTAAAMAVALVPVMIATSIYMM